MVKERDGCQRSNAAEFSVNNICGGHRHNFLPEVASIILLASNNRRSITMLRKCYESSIVRCIGEASIRLSAQCQVNITLKNDDRHRAAQKNQFTINGGSTV